MEFFIIIFPFSSFTKKYCCYIDWSDIHTIMFQSFFFREQTRHLTFQTVTEATCCFWLCPVRKALLRLLQPPAQLQRSPATGQQRLIGPSMRRLGRPVQPLGLAQLDRLVGLPDQPQPLRQPPHQQTVGPLRQHWQAGNNHCKTSAKTQSYTTAWKQTTKQSI